MANKSLDGSLIKKAHTKQQWTESQVEDMIACMDPELGYLYFSRKFFYIQHSVKGKLLFEPFEYQIGLLNSYHSKRFNVNMLPRQSGKCVINQSLITIRNNKTGEEMDITIGEFYEMQQNSVQGLECI